MSEKIKLFITDDHPMMAQGLASVLNQSDLLEVIGMAYNVQQMEETLKSCKPDVLLLDLRLAEINALDIIPDLSLKYKIIVISMFNENGIIKMAFQKGAKGYLSKNDGIDEIQSAIKTVFDGGTYLSKSLDQSSSTVSDTKKPIVTQRELEILHKISDGLSDSEIAESLFISQHTARKHRQNLIDKLGVNNSAELIKVAVQIGLV